jgi:uncharacterized metal-binding protein
MPSGQTHDRITLWALPLVTGVTFWQTKSGNLTLLVTGGFLFGGLMFGPDLDIYSRHYQRWGFLRFIWLPYQKSLRHRSFLSHGPIIGTTLRVIYLSTLVAILGFLAIVIGEHLWNVQLHWQTLRDNTASTLINYSTELLALFFGLEIGAMSHSLSDWSGSAYKRMKKQGVSGLLPRGKMKKGKVKRKARGTRKKGSRGAGEHRSRGAKE